MANRPIPLLFSARAKREIDAAHTWWVEHSEPRALADAVAAALRFMEAFTSTRILLPRILVTSPKAS